MKETVLAASLALSLLSSPAFAAETADVVVVGAGAAGLSASIGAAMRGAKVILLEKRETRVGTPRSRNSG